METLTVTLPALAERIRAEHAAAQSALATGLERMIACGELLARARELVPQGSWNRWARDDLGLDPKTVRTYIRFAANARLLRQAGVESGIAARKLLAQLELPRANDSSAQVAEATRLRADGMPVKDIALALGVSAARVSQYLNRDAHKARDRKKKAEIAAALRVREERARRAAVKRKGGEVAEAYAHVRKALEAVGKVRDRRAAAVLDALYRAEDLIVDWSRGK